MIEAAQTLLPIEAKTTARPSSDDLASVRAFMEEYEDRVAGGLLLHGGEETFWIAKGVPAAPCRSCRDDPRPLPIRNTVPPPCARTTDPDWHTGCLSASRPAAA